MNMVLFWRCMGLVGLCLTAALATLVHPFLWAGVIPSLMVGIMPVESERTNHARDVGDVKYNKEYIAAHEKTRESLTNTLQAFEFPDTGVLVNSDSPVATLVDALQRVERELNQAARLGISAQKRIYSRKRDGWHALVKDEDTNDRIS